MAMEHVSTVIMRKLQSSPLNAGRILANVLAGAVAVIVACSSSVGSNTGSKKPVHCSSDADCSNGQWCSGDTCVAPDADSGPPPKAMHGTGGRSSSSTCGNGVAEGSESCDGSDLKNETCATATMNPAIRGTVTCTSSCTFDLRACKLAPDAGLPGRGGTFGGGGSGGTFSGAGGFIGFPEGGTYTPAPPLPCGRSSCLDPLIGAPASLASTLALSACCLDASTGTCGTMLSGGTCDPIPEPDPTCPTSTTLPGLTLVPCCSAGLCGQSLLERPCVTGVDTPTPVTCGTGGAQAF